MVPGVLNQNTPEGLVLLVHLILRLAAGFIQSKTFSGALSALHWFLVNVLSIQLLLVLVHAPLVLLVPSIIQYQRLQTSKEPWRKCVGAAGEKF